jgi:ubiquinone biosynthesis protein UbiJ
LNSKTHPDPETLNWKRETRNLEPSESAMTVPPTMLRFAQEAVNFALRLDLQTLARLGELHGRRVRVGLTLTSGEPFDLDVLPSEAGLGLEPAGDAEPDVTIRGAPGVFARLILGEGAPRATGELAIRGDIELGNRFRAVFERLDIDWEEHASRFVGDIAAHELGRAVRALGAWGRGAARTLAADAGEFLQEESRLLPRRERLEEFLTGVDRLRDDAERLAKRLERIEAVRR